MWIISGALLAAYENSRCSPEQAAEYSADTCSDGEKALWYIRDEILNNGKIVNPNEYRRRALRKILDATPETWEATCYLCLCTPGILPLKAAEQALMEHIGEQP